VPLRLEVLIIYSRSIADQGQSVKIDRFIPVRVIATNVAIVQNPAFPLDSAL
jgi:hypothetical protein